MLIVNEIQELINSVLKDVFISKKNSFTNPLHDFLSMKKLPAVLFLMSKNITFRNMLNKNDIIDLFCILFLENSLLKPEIIQELTHNFLSVEKIMFLDINPNFKDYSLNFQEIIEKIKRKKKQFHFPKLNFCNRKIHKTVIGWLKNNICENEDYMDSLISRLNKLQLLTVDSHKIYMDNIIIPIFELAINISVSSIPKNSSGIFIKKLSSSFSYMFIISEDMNNMSNYFVEENSKTLNYCINFGLQKSYEKYMESKTELLTILELIPEISGIRYLIFLLDEKINAVIKKTNPEICSSISQY